MSNQWMGLCHWQPTLFPKEQNRNPVCFNLTIRPKKVAHTRVFHLNSSEMSYVKASLAPLMPNPSQTCEPGVRLLQLANAIMVGYCFNQNVFVHHGNPLFESTGRIYAPHGGCLGRGLKEELDRLNPEERKNE